MSTNVYTDKFISNKPVMRKDQRTFSVPLLAVLVTFGLMFGLVMSLQTSASSVPSVGDMADYPSGP